MHICVVYSEMLFFFYFTSFYRPQHLHTSQIKGF